MSDKRDGHPASGTTRTRHAAILPCEETGPRCERGGTPDRSTEQGDPKPSGRSSSCRSPSPGRSFRERKPHEHRREANPMLPWAGAISFSRASYFQRGAAGPRETGWMPT